MHSIPSIFVERAAASRIRLDEVRDKIKNLDELQAIESLTIFGAGSYARHEASEYSDIDMFFLCTESREDQVEPRTKELRLFGKMIGVIEELNFPKFSNDCQYLSLLSIKDIIHHLGSPIDDHENYFTARMLLLLESKYLYGEDTYNEVISNIVKSYFTDYPSHSERFQPIFLLNDICRYWKTLLLNYENKRKRENIEEERVKHRVRNFKLKFSRMTTCFATIAALGSCCPPVSEQDVIRLVHLTPIERLQEVMNRMPATEPEILDILDKYAWFMGCTGLSTEELRKYFRDDNAERHKMFKTANEYGNSMFKLLQKLDQIPGNEAGLLRYLVI